MELKEGEAYISVRLDLGCLGTKDVAFFPNKDKTKDTEPDFKSRYGAVWINKKKSKQKEEMI